MFLKLLLLNTASGRQPVPLPSSSPFSPAEEISSCLLSQRCFGGMETGLVLYSSALNSLAARSPAKGPPDGRFWASTDGGIILHTRSQGEHCFLLKVEISSHVYIIMPNWKLKILRGELNAVCVVPVRWDGVAGFERWLLASSYLWKKGTLLKSCRNTPVFLQVHFTRELANTERKKQLRNGADGITQKRTSELSSCLKLPQGAWSSCSPGRGAATEQ